MSRQNKQGAWVVPEEQVKEFMSGSINWKKLIDDCLQQPEHQTFGETQKLKEKAKAKKKKTSFFTIEI